MPERDTIAVVGLGEIGRPLFDLVSRHYEAVGVDITPVESTGQVDIMHVCYPFQIDDFVAETVRYVKLFTPSLTVINSTVGIGTTRRIAELTGAALVNSPVRGKHARMIEDLLVYTKFVGAIDPVAGAKAVEHFTSLGLKTKLLPSPEATELAKLTETTYFGLLIAWAQEVERYCDHFGEDYEDVVSFYEEISFFPTVRYFPGVIGGHCVMQNMEILKKSISSDLLAAIQESNRKKVDREIMNKTETLPAIWPAS